MTYGRFGALLGTIYIGHTHCKFLIYAARNAEVLTCHEVALREISQQPGWIEFDPIEVWQSVVECIETATQNLILLDINPADIVAIAITNQRETTILWNNLTGLPLHNAIAWNDTRTTPTLNKILTKIRHKKNYLKSICGLPFSNCFSAIKIKWLMDNVDGIKATIRDRKCFFGTLDTWILWNLTGGLDDGVHITDVTNASRTMLMSLEQLQWDNSLCTFFQIPAFILPTIKSSAERYGYVCDGPLKGIPIMACIGEQSGSLLGQMCLRATQATCTYEDGCYLLINTGQEIIDSNNGLLTTVAFQLGHQQKPFYALEGAIAYAGSAVNWLKENMNLNTDLQAQNSGGNTNGLAQSFLGESAALSSYSSNSNFGNTLSLDSSLNTNVVLVPAFSGLHSPYWKHTASGLLLGLNNRTTACNVILAAYEAVCYQTRDLLEALINDVPTWTKFDKLTVGGEFSENRFFLQLLADLCGLKIVRPQTTFPSCLGAMLAAASAMDLIKFNGSIDSFTPPYELFKPALCSTRRDSKYRTWKYAVNTCKNWDGEVQNSLDNYLLADKDPDVLMRCSIPGTVYFISSVALYLITKYYRNL